MYCGMAFIIYDKESYFANKEKIKKLLITQAKNESNICSANVIEFHDNLYLIIDGHDSLMDWMQPEEELELLKESYEELIEYSKKVPPFTDTRFLHNLLMLTYPDYAKNPNSFYEAYEALVSWSNAKYTEKIQSLLNRENPEIHKNLPLLKEKAAPFLNREHLCFGTRYFEVDEFCTLMFQVSEKDIETLSQNIFDATIKHKNVGEIKFIETLFDLLPSSRIRQKMRDIKNTFKNLFTKAN